MKTITLTQPWATLVTIMAKQIETRSWKTNYRGPLAIHAAKGFPKDAQALRKLAPFRQYLDGHNLPLGAIIATCNLIACVRIISVSCTFNAGILAGVTIPPNEPELSFGDYRPGRWAWILSDIQPLKNPLPAKGSLGLWDCDISTLLFLK